MVEVKWHENDLSSNFKIFEKFFPGVQMIQVSKKLNREKTFPNGAQIRQVVNWLSDLTLP